MMVIIDEDARCWLSSVMITVMMRLEMQRVRSHHYHHDCFIIIMTVGDAEDAR